MIRHALLRAWLLCIFPALFVQVAQASEPDILLGVAVRVDQVDWNIADTDGNPNVLSELTWRDLVSVAMQGQFQSMLGRWLHMQLDGQLGVIVSGDNQDSDYALNNRQGEFSRSNNDGGKGSVADVSVAFGVNLNAQPHMQIVPQAGIASFIQQLTIKDGYQTINAFGSTGPIPGLNSSYDTRWYGPFAGLYVQWDTRQSTRWAFQLHRYVGIDYVAEANWNLRTDFMHPVSFRHEASASGIGFILSWQNTYSLGRRHGLRFEWHRMSTEAGIDRVFFSNGAIVETRLNEANWQKIGVGFYIVF